MNTGTNISNLLAASGQETARAALAGGQANANMAGALGGGLGQFAGGGGFKGLFGGSSPNTVNSAQFLNNIEMQGF